MLFALCGKFLSPHFRVVFPTSTLSLDMCMLSRSVNWQVYRIRVLTQEALLLFFAQTAKPDILADEASSIVSKINTGK